MVAGTGQPLAGRNVLLGVCGSVAAYKAAELARLLVTAGAGVRVALTPAATRFVAPLTFQALTGAPPVTDMFAGTGSPDGMDHIAAARAADLIVIAPATASAIARLAHGDASEPVSALACAATCPVLVAPAMNREMWANPAVTRNVAALQADGRHVLDTPVGDLACGEHGPGRLSEPPAILAAVIGLLDPGERPLAGRKVVVSAGATVEAIDDMRVLTNRSSGRMGCAVAAAAQAAGAQVHLVAGTMAVPVPAGFAQVTHAPDGSDMQAAVRRACRGADCFISVAAVADFRPKKQVPGKLRRGDGLNLVLEPVPDIIATVARGRDAPMCIAFAAEAGGMPAAVKSAKAKLVDKGVSAVVASPLKPNLGGERCDLVVVTADGTNKLGTCAKDEGARRLVAWLAGQLD